MSESVSAIHQSLVLQIIITQGIEQFLREESSWRRHWDDSETGLIIFLEPTRRGARFPSDPKSEVRELVVVVRSSQLNGRITKTVCDGEVMLRWVDESSFAVYGKLYRDGSAIQWADGTLWKRKR